jgi:hypothetical protein
VRYPEPRSVRRAAKRAADTVRAEERRTAKAERRAAERRVEPLRTGQSLDDKLRQLGLGRDRRSGSDRRR